MPPETDLSRGAGAIRGARLTIVAGTRDQYVTGDALSSERARLDAAGIAYDVDTTLVRGVISRGVFPKILGDAAVQRERR